MRVRESPRVDEDVQRLPVDLRESSETGDRVAAADDVDPRPHDFVGESAIAVLEVLSHRFHCKRRTDGYQQAERQLRREQVQHVARYDGPQTVGDHDELASLR